MRRDPLLGHVPLGLTRLSRDGVDCAWVETGRVRRSSTGRLCSWPSSWRRARPRAQRTQRERGTPLQGIHKIRHIVIIMQENRSFDSYFGTYPGADGIPGLAGNPGPLPCVPDPETHGCDRPYHDSKDRNSGGPHGHATALGRHRRRPDGRLRRPGRARPGGLLQEPRRRPTLLVTPRKPDVMGYHDWREIPNYWDYASNFVLQDHMFESDTSWSLPEHLYLVSGWSAKCTKKGDPLSCHSAVQDPGAPPG